MHMYSLTKEKSKGSIKVYRPTPPLSQHFALSEN